MYGSERTPLSPRTRLGILLVAFGLGSLFALRVPVLSLRAAPSDGRAGPGDAEAARRNGFHP